MKVYNKVEESTRARIAELEEEITQYTPFVHDLEGSASTLQDWSERDSLLREALYGAFGKLRLER